MGSSTSTQQTQSSTTPWSPQAAALTGAFQNAQTAYGQSSQAVAPTNYTAQFTPDQLATFQQMLGYSNGNTTPASQAASGAALSSAGTSATTGALSGLGSFNPSATNNPQTLVDAANQYVAGQNIPAQVAQAMQSADETARDVTMPGIDQNAAMTGNTNSSRTGIADGIVQRGLAETAGNLSGSLSSQAFQNGLTLAQQQAENNNTSELGALSGAASYGTNAVNSGVNAGTAGVTNQGTLYGLAENAGLGEQSADQANLTNQQQQYQAQTQDPYAALSAEMGIIGSQNWGSNTSGTQTTTSTPSAWQVIGGLLGAAGQGASSAGSLGWKPFS